MRPGDGTQRTPDQALSLERLSVTLWRVQAETALTSTELVSVSDVKEGSLTFLLNIKVDISPEDVQTHFRRGHDFDTCCISSVRFRSRHICALESAGLKVVGQAMISRAFEEA